MIPLSTAMRPKRLEDFRGQEHFLYPGSLLYNAIKNRTFVSGIFYGPPGTGKTTLARIIAAEMDAQFCEINASAAGTKELKEDTGRGEVQVLRAGKQDDLSLCRRVSPLEQASAGFSAEGAGGGRHTFYRKYHGKSLFCRK